MDDIISKLKDVIMLEIIKNGYFLNSKKYDGLYYSANEEVEEILSNFSLENKNVLSVIGSGDQAFHLYNFSANKIDLFDRNKLSINIYYLRLWIIKYMKKYYLPIDKDNSQIILLLKQVKPETKDEVSALKFWKLLFRIDKNISLEGTFCDSPKYMCNINDVETLVKNMSKKTSTFYNIDISKNLRINKKYDIVYVSNILDWILIEISDFIDYMAVISNKSQNLIEQKFNRYYNNLARLTKDDGIVIGAYVKNKQHDYFQKILAEKLFDIHEIYKEEEPIGYYYTKKSH